jgi:hypothetical protein
MAQKLLRMCVPFLTTGYSPGTHFCGDEILRTYVDLLSGIAAFLYKEYRVLPGFKIVGM